MKTEDEARDAMIRAELEKIMKMNPSTIPIYLIISTAEENQLPEIPIMLSSKELPLSDIVSKLNLKYPKHPLVYLFGEDHSVKHSHEQLSQKQKRKMKVGQKPCCDHEHTGQKIIQIDEKNSMKSVGQLHTRYMDSNKMLVVVMSSKPLIIKKQPKPYQSIFILLALLFAGLYLFVSLYDGTETPQHGTVIGNSTL